jgi:hypothetical protein
LVNRIGNAAFTATLAAALASLPAAVRLAQADASFPMAWAVLTAIALVPMAALVPIFRSAREGLRAWAGDGARENGLGFGVWLVAMLAFMARFGAMLRAKTHHHALAGVTFAIGALVLGAGLGIFVVRGVRWARRDRERGGIAHTIVFGLVTAALVVLVAKTVPAGLSPTARAAAIDATAAVVALLVAASRTLKARKVARLGGPLAGVFVISALFSSHELRSLVALAPLHSALTGILSALR